MSYMVEEQEIMYGALSVFVSLIDIGDTVEEKWQVQLSTTRMSQSDMLDYGELLQLLWDMRCEFCYSQLTNGMYGLPLESCKMQVGFAKEFHTENESRQYMARLMTKISGKVQKRGPISAQLRKKLEGLKKGYLFFKGYEDYCAFCEKHNLK